MLKNVSFVILLLEMCVILDKNRQQENVFLLILATSEKTTVHLNKLH